MPSHRADILLCLTLFYPSLYAAALPHCEVVDNTVGLEVTMIHDGQSFIDIRSPAQRQLRFLIEGSVSIPVDQRRALYGVLREENDSAAALRETTPDEHWFLMYADVTADVGSSGREKVMLWLDHWPQPGMTDDTQRSPGLMLELRCARFTRFLEAQSPADEQWSRRHEQALQSLAPHFVQAFVDHRRLFENTFLGVPIWQNPMDVWSMQRLVTRMRPDVIIETGTAYGGSALFFAVLLEHFAPHARVITVDIDPLLETRLLKAKAFPVFSRRVRVVHGDSVAASTLETVRALLEGVSVQKTANEPTADAAPLHVLVTLDSLHSNEHVLKEMQLYAPFVAPGGYMLVQDTLIDAEPRYLDWFVRRWSKGSEGGPGRAVEEFLAEHDEFVRDATWSSHPLTFHPGGLLKRIR